MERARRLATTLRTHWKKSLFLTGVGLYGAKWYNKKLQNEAFMRELCQEAIGYGSGTIQGAETPLYNVTVILNPVASGGKARKLYEKYCAPLLNLAGMKVSVMRTESEGQAKEIMEIMSDADAVLVAGGDGTLMEAVTGLLRRTDNAAAKLPLGVLPVGKTNTLAHRLFQCDDEVRLMGEATMAVVRQLRRPVSVMEVENRAEDENMRGKKLYFMNRLEVGAWKDARLRADKYWLFGFGLKNYVTYLGSFTTGSKHVSWSCDLDLQTSSSPASSHSPASSSADNKTPSSSGSSGLLARLLGRNKAGPSVSEEVEQRVTAEKTWTDLGHFEGPQLTIEREGDGLKSILYEPTSFTDFVSHGWDLWAGRQQPVYSSAKISSVAHRVVESTDSLLTPRLVEERETNICVDGEVVPLEGPVQVRVVKDPLVMFCTRAEAVTEREEAASPVSRWSSLGSSLTRQNRLLTH